VNPIFADYCLGICSDFLLWCMALGEN